MNTGAIKHHQSDTVIGVNKSIINPGMVAQVKNYITGQEMYKLMFFMTCLLFKWEKFSLFRFTDLEFFSLHNTILSVVNFLNYFPFASAFVFS